jgi:hypothetical protein
VEKEQRSLRSKQLERTSLFERSVQLRRRVTQLEHYLVELADRKDRLEQSMVRQQESNDKQIEKWQRDQNTWQQFHQWVAWQHSLPHHQQMIDNPSNTNTNNNNNNNSNDDIEVVVEAMSQYEEVFTPRGMEPMSPSTSSRPRDLPITNTSTLANDANIYAPLTTTNNADGNELQTANSNDASSSSQQSMEINSNMSPSRVHVLATGTRRRLTSRSNSARQKKARAATTNMARNGDGISPGTASDSYNDSSLSPTRSTATVVAAATNNNNGGGSLTWRSVGRARASAARSAAVYEQISPIGGRKMNSVKRQQQQQHQQQPRRGHNTLSNNSSVTFEEKEDMITFTPRPPPSSISISSTGAAAVGTLSHEEKTPQRSSILPAVTPNGSRVVNVDRRWVLTSSSNSNGHINSMNAPAASPSSGWNDNVASSPHQQRTELVSFVSLPPVEPLNRMAMPSQ